MLQGISDATNIGIYHAVTTKVSKQKKNSNISNNDDNNNNNKNKNNNFNINSIDFTKIGHHLFLHSKSAPVISIYVRDKVLNNNDNDKSFPSPKF